MDRLNGGDNTKKMFSRGDDTMSATAVNYTYKVIIKGKEKPVPAMTKQDLELIKARVGKYLKNK